MLFSPLPIFILFILLRYDDSNEGKVSSAHSKDCTVPLYDFPQACFFLFVAQTLVAHMSLSHWSGEDPLFTVHGIYCTCSYGNEAEAQTSGCNYMGDNDSNYYLA